MKHVARRHFYVRDMVEAFEIEVPFVDTANNIADFFTKPMKSSKQFYAFRRIIMNEGAERRRSGRTPDQSHPAGSARRLTLSRGGASVDTRS